MQVLKGVGFLERSRWLVLLNLGPLKMFKSRNSTCESDMLHVNLSVGCALLSLSRKLSNSSGAWPDAEDVIYVAFPKQRLDRFVG